MRACLLSTVAWAIALVLCGCQSNGYGPQIIMNRAAAEALAGARAAEHFEPQFGGVCSDDEAEHRMAALLLQLRTAVRLPHREYYCRLLDTDELNAASLPGNRVYITRALYDQLSSDDAVAAVLAHEMAHITGRDHFKDRATACDVALERELDADLAAIAYLSAAGFDPHALGEALALIAPCQPPSWSATRFAQLEAATASLSQRRSLAHGFEPDVVHAEHE